MLQKLTDALLDWYSEHKRDLPWRGEGISAYHTWISEIMLQQTRVEAVKGYYLRFIAALPEMRDLAAVDDDLLLKLWEGLGYYSRAKNLKKAAQIVMRDYGGTLPRDPAELLKLPGIGLYTAGAIASLRYGVAVPAVDGNVLRVLSRLEGNFDDIALERTKKSAAMRLLRVIPQDRPGEFNQALMELGATVCLPNGEPKCAQCPWVGDCTAQRQGLISQLPVKSAKKPRKIEEKHLLILRCENRVALRRRPEKGLLAGLWELPEAFDLPEGCVISSEDAGKAVHIFTHREWHMRATRVVLSVKLEGFTWVTPEELLRDYALPSAFSYYKEKLFG